jgi:DNA-binding protein Fis
VVSEHFEALIQRLFAPETPSSLPEREKKAMLDRVLKAKVTEVQKQELAGVIEAVLEGMEKPEWGREQVVGFITRNAGVAGWAMSVRRGVEGVKQ